MDNCIFCKIAKGDIPARLVGENELALAFWDVAPRKPLHILIIPKAHYSNVVELTKFDEPSLLAVMKLASDLSEKLAEDSFRLTFNTGAGAGQSVFHAHGHLTSENPKAGL